MAMEGNMDYATARIHARLSQLPDEAAWRRIESSRDLPHYLNAVRASTLADWVASIEPSNDAHEVERALRSQWTRHVKEVTQWHPREWQAWITWTAWLPVLALLAGLARSSSPPAWMLADPLLGALVPGSQSERGAALTRMGLGPIASAVRGRTPVGEAWLAHWQNRLPKANFHTRLRWHALLRALQQQAEEMQIGAIGPSVRERLRERLLRLFRNSEDSAMTSMCYLGLLALHLERLRGGLIRRKLFPVDAGALH